MTKIMVSEISRVPVPYRKGVCIYRPLQRHCSNYSDGRSFYKFDSETVNNKFKFRKFKNVIDKFRVEFRVRTKIRTI
jgi:hypothetical protein